MADEENDKQPDEDEQRSILLQLQGTSRERLLDALAKYLADEERRRKFLQKIRTL
jgi:hypothetical protein